MAIGTAAAILGGAAIIGGIGGSILGADATRDAARDASAAQQESTAQQIALAREFRNQNQGNLQPWLSSGQRANSLIDSFLYAPTTTTYYPDQTPTGMGGPRQPTPQGPVQGPVTQPTQVPTAPTMPGGAIPAEDRPGRLIDGSGRRAGGMVTHNALMAPGDKSTTAYSNDRGFVDDSGMAPPVPGQPAPQPGGQPAQGGMTEAQWAQGAIDAMMPNISRSSVRNTLASMRDNPIAALDYLMRLSPPSSDQYPLYQAYLSRNPRPTATVQPQPGTQPGGQPGQPGQPQQNPMTGYEAFVRSPYYQTGLNEGMNMLNNGWAANGMIQSGAAMRGAERFGQDYAYGRMDEFLGMAGQQSDRGLQAGSAIAGVGQNALASTSAAIQSGADARSNAAIASGNATAGMWGGIGSTLGNVFGTFGSSYRR